MTINKLCMIDQVRMEPPAEEGQAPKIIGYAAKFNTRSNNLGGFVEEIAPGAFDDVLNDDTRALFNHDPSMVLGRNGSTLILSLDSIGLRYEITPPDTQTVNDLVIEPIKRGDISGSSFGFHLPSDGYRWDEDDNGVFVRTITRVSKLMDVGPVTYPAYNDTEAAARSLDEFKRSQQQNQTEQIEIERLQANSHRERYLQTL